MEEIFSFIFLVFNGIIPLMTRTAYIALGTNLGDRLENLRAAIHALESDVRITGKSSVYETPPWGYEDQPAFLNMVVCGKTNHSPDALLVFLKKLESELGRTPNFRWGPRLIDLDILFYDDLVIDTPPLIVPHPRLHERAFVLIPLLDLDPDLVHPILKRTLRDLARHVDPSGMTKFAEI